MEKNNCTFWKLPRNEQDLRGEALKCQIKQPNLQETASSLAQVHICSPKGLASLTPSRWKRWRESRDSSQTPEGILVTGILSQCHPCSTCSHVPMNSRTANLDFSLALLCSMHGSLHSFSSAKASAKDSLRVFSVPDDRGSSRDTQLFNILIH